MSALEIGQKLVAAVNQGRAGEDGFVAEYYDENIVSLEGSDDPDMARMEGIASVKGKHEWWWGNHEVHSSTAEGPYVGQREDQFIVKFILDTTPDGGERNTMQEVGLFTIANGKIVQEEFLYQMG